MSCEGFIAGCGKSFQVGFHSRNRGVRNDQGKGTGFVPHHEVEQRLFGDGMRSVIMCKFSVRDRFRPRCGIIAAEDSEICRFPLLGLPIPSQHLFVGDRWCYRPIFNFLDSSLFFLIFYSNFRI